MCVAAFLLNAGHPGPAFQQEKTRKGIESDGSFANLPSSYGEESVRMGSVSRARADTSESVP